MTRFSASRGIIYSAPPGPGGGSGDDGGSGATQETDGTQPTGTDDAEPVETERKGAVGADDDAEPAVRDAAADD